MNDYYFNMKSLVKDLRCLKNIVGDNEFVLYPMESLGLEYDFVVMIIISRLKKLPLYILLCWEKRIEKNLLARNINLALNISANYTNSGYNNN